MKCTEARRKISLLIDGELAGPEKGGLDAHCAACAGCRREREEMELLFSGISAPAAAAPSPYFFNKVLLKIREDRESGLFLFPALKWARTLPLGVIAALMLLAGNFFGSALWTGVSAETTKALLENVPGISTFSDMPQEFAGIYYTDAERG